MTNIPEGWEESIVSDVADVLNGYAFKSSDLGSEKEGSLPVFKMGNINKGGGLKWTGKEDYYTGDADDIDEKFFSKPFDILMCMTDMKANMNLLGYSARIKNEKFLINQRVGIVRPKKDKIDPVYLSYFMNCKLYIDLLRTTAHSGVQVNLSTDGIKNSPVRFPNLNKQKAIAKLLSTIDDKIELNNQINHNLYQINDKLFNEYFGKYYEGELPDNWKLGKLTDYANINNGYSYTGKELVDDSEMGMVTIKNFERNGGFKLGGFKPISPLKNVEKFMLNKSDIVVACTDLTQNADIVGNAELTVNAAGFDDIIYSMDVVEIEPRDIDKYYLYATLKSSVFKNFALEYVSGSTVLHLSKNCFKDFELIIPDEQKMKQFSGLIKANCNKIMNNTEMNIKLTKMRDTLLPKLMNGEINLDNVTI